LLVSLACIFCRDPCRVLPVYSVAILCCNPCRVLPVYFAGIDGRVLCVYCIFCRDCCCVLPIYSVGIAVVSCLYILSGLGLSLACIFSLPTCFVV
jgi:hypothetical protein